MQSQTRALLSVYVLIVLPTLVVPRAVRIFNTYSDTPKVLAQTWTRASLSYNKAVGILGRYRTLGNFKFQNPKFYLSSNYLMIT